MAQTVLRCEHVSTFFPVRGSLGQVTGQVQAVKDVSLSLEKGKTYGLVGESGCGKSTLGRTLIRLLEPSEGSICLFDEDISHLPERDMRRFRRRMQMAFQDPYTSLNPRIRVGDALMEVLKIHGVTSRDERMEAALEMLQRVGLLKEHFYKYPHEFSGGQRQRIGLCRALMLSPEILICDEPVSALDVSIQSQIINLLCSLQDERHLSYLFISHDMGVIRYISDTVGVMYLGHLVEEGSADEIFSHPLHPYTRMLLSAVPALDPHADAKRMRIQGELPSPLNPPTGCVFHTRCPYATAQCAQAVPSLQDQGGGHMCACLRATEI
ncbi:MAG: dipeptide ABC transporter ATP-binding protein [Clostridia bacterium]|nr:dipeptide ABC transporter ATP-binding protein [Clostridia bacterium]